MPHSMASRPELQKKTVSAKLFSVSRRPGSLLVGNIVQVRGMPEPAGLILERGDEAGMGVAESGHGDPAAEVQEPPPVGREEVGALAFFESDVPVPVGRHQGGDHDRVSFKGSSNMRPRRKPAGKAA